MMKHILFVIALSLISSSQVSASGSRKHYARIVTRAASGSSPKALPTYPSGPGFAIPALNDIGASPGAPQPTVPLPPLPPGAAPFDAAPTLPDLSKFDANKYPPLDKVPPTNSPEVKEWLKEIQGAKIPNFSPTINGSCDLSPKAAEEAGPSGRCWRSCGGCMRATDITTCAQKNHWGLTFDDGPSEYTPKLLHYLNSEDLKATFFLVGSRVVSAPETVQYQHQTGHQLSVHTWSHSALTSLTTEQIVAELGWTRKAIKDTTGVSPLTMRPPFGDIDDRVRAISMAMGMIPIIWTGVGVENEFDTNDWRVPAGLVKASETVNTFRKVLDKASTLNTGFVVLEHDLFSESVDLAIGFTIPNALARKPSLTLEPVSTCQEMPMTDAYLETNKNASNPAIVAGPGRGKVAPSVSTIVGSTSVTSTASGTNVPSKSTAAATSTGPIVSKVPAVSRVLSTAPAASTTPAVSTAPAVPTEPAVTTVPSVTATLVESTAPAVSATPAESTVSGAVTGTTIRTSLPIRASGSPLEVQGSTSGTSSVRRNSVYSAILVVTIASWVVM